MSVSLLILLFVFLLGASQLDVSFSCVSRQPRQHSHLLLWLPRLSRTLLHFVLDFIECAMT